MTRSEPATIALFSIVKRESRFCSELSGSAE